MRYQGGKTVAGRKIASFLNEQTKSRTYVEPFLGGANVMCRIVAEHRIGSDINSDLIEMWRSVQNGWRPPEKISRVRYEELRNAPSSPERTYAGFALSFGAKWFGGYSADGDPKKNDFNKYGSSAIKRQAEGLKDVALISSSYEDLIIEDGAVIYCDPPYVGTTQYQGQPFDHEKFWRWALDLACRCEVYVSEQQVPSFARLVLPLTVQAMGKKDGFGSYNRTEGLYQVKP